MNLKNKLKNLKLSKLFKSKNIVVLLLVVIIFFELNMYFHSKVAFISQEEASKSQLVPDTLSPESIISERNRWSKRMDEIGVEKAYEEFKKQYANKHFGVQHTMAHIIGQMIYKKKGMAGVTICDSTFAFGCYHSFYAQALADKGTSVISIADKACTDKFGPLGTGCQHGIGHGLMDYYGPDKLAKALATCSMTTQLKKLFGCTSGVFMEYNVPIIISATSAETIPRVLDKSHPYAPCPSLPEKYQESCYYEMAQWWDKSSTFNGDYKKIGELCQTIALLANRESCFLGIGNVAAPSSNYTVTGTIKRCDAMPTFETKMVCRSGASWSFFSSVTYRPLATEVCADLDPAIQKRCVQKSDLIGNGLK